MPHPVKSHVLNRWTNQREYIEPVVWELIPRVSDVVGTISCEFTAYNNDVNRVARGEEPLWLGSANYPALRGTMAHYEIQTTIDDDLGVDTPELTLSDAENALLVQIEEMGELDTLYSEISERYDNWTKWNDEYNPRYIKSEQEIVHIKYRKDGSIDPTKSLKGTVDCIAEFDLNNMSNKAINELLPDDNWEFTHDKFISIADWKTGDSKMAVHELQIVAYDYLLTDSGWWTENVENGLLTSPKFSLEVYGIQANYGMCIKLGSKNPTKSNKRVSKHWLNDVYDLDEKKDFFLAWDRFNSARPIPYKEKTRSSVNFKTRCMFCEHRPYCPIFCFRPYKALELKTI